MLSRVFFEEDPDLLSAQTTVSVLGATGAIGSSTLDIVANHPQKFAVSAVTANTSVEKLTEIALRFDAKFAAIGDERLYQDLKEALSGSGIEVAAGSKGLNEAADYPSQQVMSSIVGTPGFNPTLVAVERGATVLLANKESLVCSGDLLKRKVKECDAQLLPIDSEHNAIFQAFDWDHPESVTTLTLTASGGPFRDHSLEQMKKATPAQALKHPSWSMGAKISVDSASMINKGLELIEASYLFDMPEDKIEVLVHPQSIVHSMVGYKDGSVLAQMGVPDMRIPIAHAMAWPQRIVTPVSPLNLAEIGKLTFSLPDLKRFPALALARNALQKGGSAPLVYNAANEIAVEAFLQERIGFLDISELVAKMLDHCSCAPCDDVDAVLARNREVRAMTLAALSTP